MILLIISIVLNCISSNIEQKSKYVLFYNQPVVLKPIPTDQPIFWSDYSNFDTIIIEGDRLIEDLEYEFSQFKMEHDNSAIYSTFSINSALIRYSGITPIDTIYADRFFKFWLIKGKLFEDRRKKVRTKFSTFLKDTDSYLRQKQK
jgi:hypothetical protein